MTTERILELCLARQSADPVQSALATAELRQRVPRLAGELVAERLRADALASASSLLLTPPSEARDTEIAHHVKRLCGVSRSVVSHFWPRFPYLYLQPLLRGVLAYYATTNYPSQ
jgi:hypothetical protein